MLTKDEPTHSLAKLHIKFQLFYSQIQIKSNPKGKIKQGGDDGRNLQVPQQTDMPLAPQFIGRLLEVNMQTSRQRSL